MSPDHAHAKPARPGTVSGFGPLAALRRDFPGWSIFPSSGVRTRYWASRRANREKPPDLPPDAAATWAMTVDGDSAAQLREAIAEQETCSGP